MIVQESPDQNEHACTSEVKSLFPRFLLCVLHSVCTSSDTIQVMVVFVVNLSLVLNFFFGSSLSDAAIAVKDMNIDNNIKLIFMPSLCELVRTVGFEPTQAANS